VSKPTITAGDKLFWMGIRFLEEVCQDESILLTVCITAAKTSKHVVGVFSCSNASEVIDFVVSCIPAESNTPHQVSVIVRSFGAYDESEEIVVSGIVYQDELWIQVEPETVELSSRLDPKTKEVTPESDDDVYCLFEEMFDGCPTFLVPADRFTVG
jgi:hypothetical protein